MSINDYQFCKLAEMEISKIKNLEKDLNNDNKEDGEIILLAFNKNN